MKAIYIRPITELVKVELQKDISESWDAWATSQWQNSGNANENFFSEEDDDADPFFDD